MANYIAQVRTNIRFDVEKDTELKPSIELIILTYSPKYTVEGKGKVMKSTALDEQRLEIDADGLNDLIAQLQGCARQLLPYAQAGKAITAILKDGLKPAA